jgi:hypothetical protein
MRGHGLPGQNRELGIYLHLIVHWRRGYMTPGKITEGTCGVLEPKRALPQEKGDAQHNQPTKALTLRYMYMRAFNIKALFTSVYYTGEL